MKLSDFLSHASIETLRSMAKYQELDCSMHSKHDLLQSLLFNMRIRSQVRSLTQGWVEMWGDVLVRIGMSTRSQFSAEEIHALFTANGHDAKAMEKALGQGWLFAQKKGSLRPTYVVPEEIQSAIRAYLLEQYQNRIRVRGTAPLIQQDETSAIVDDFQTFLDYVLHHEVTLTAEGAMYKRHVQQLMELFQVSESLEIPKWRFGYGRRTHDYPDRLALLYDFAYDQGFIVEAPEQTLQLTEKVIEWRKTARVLQQQRIVNFYVRLYRRPIPRLKEVVSLVSSLATDWVASDSILDVCGPMVSAFYYDSREDVWNVRIVKMLTHLGILCRGFDDESDEEWFQMTKLGQELLSRDEIQIVEEKNTSQAALIVQPNFEVMVTVPDSQLETVLAEFADLKSAGAIRIYRILDRTVKRGFESGYDFEAWRAMLSKRSLGPVPGNVEHTLVEWEEQYQSSSRPISS